MTKETLMKARDLLVDALDKSNIDIVDKVELMTNLWLYLNPAEYENNNKVLQKSINNRRN